MKKLAAAAAVVLAALFLFAGCSSQITVTLYSGWLSNTANNYERDFYESLDYKVSFTPAETSTWVSYAVDENEANSSYNITTEAIGTYTCPENAVTYTNVYQLTITIQTAASFSFSSDGAEQTVAFGGENDENPDNDPAEDFQADDADSVVYTVWFCSLDSTSNSSENESLAQPALRPIRSVQEVRSHGLQSQGQLYVNMFNYTITTVYDETCDNATITYEDAYADLSSEDSAASDYVRKTPLIHPANRTVSDLQKNYSCFDNAQLYFMARGLTQSTETSQTVTVVGGTANNIPATMTISWSELVDRSVDFTLDGEQVSGMIPTAVTNFSLGDSIYTGEGATVIYAQRQTPNTYHCLPVSIEEPLGYSLGSTVYTLKEASYTRGAQETA